MPIIFYILLFILLAISLRKKKTSGFLDIDSSNTIKGFFVLLVVFSHILNAFPYGGFMSEPLGLFRKMLGQLLVSMFFFISGYGIFLSIDSKGSTYSKSLITNRFLRLIIYAVIGLVPYFVYSAFLGKSHDSSDYILAVFGLRSFGNPTWFLFAILICYLIASIIFMFNWKNLIVPAAIISFGVLIYIFAMFFTKSDVWMWDTIICFSYGMFAYLLKDKICRFLSNKKFVPWILMIVSLSILIVVRFLANSRYSIYFPDILTMWFSNFFFCFFFVCLTFIFTLKSRVLQFVGKSSFSVYFMHLFILNFFVDIGKIQFDVLNYLVLFMVCPAFGVLYQYVYSLADKYIIKPIVSDNRKFIQ